MLHDLLKANTILLCLWSKHNVENVLVQCQDQANTQYISWGFKAEAKQTHVYLWATVDMTWYGGKQHVNAVNETDLLFLQ